ncbi:hypothetical protein AMJ44_09560 [candidate division WOR-1 bacterium DG_54_3]|uniref:Uncharacterized protein n=1 Tax=candidate division WOR-1 bacterium DG_54_3 TaxID=1703775 RepID=A0A0S7XTJ2_UNCSA|nr:MAG: hypothetical protein AMJ44_09560 [candidate division WOR-1 bacterium DG_54_3]
MNSCPQKEGWGCNSYLSTKQLQKTAKLISISAGFYPRRVSVTSRIPATGGTRLGRVDDNIHPGAGVRMNSDCHTILFRFKKYVKL